MWKLAVRKKNYKISINILINSIALYKSADSIYDIKHHNEAAKASTSKHNLFTVKSSTTNNDEDVDLKL